MARIIRVGGSSSETSWHEALKDLRADDVLMLGLLLFATRLNTNRYYD